MANMLFGTWKGSLLTGTASVAVNTNSTQAGMYGVLLSSAVGVVGSSWETFSDFSSAYSGAVSTAHYLLTPTVSSATFDSSDITFASVAAGSTLTGVLLIRLIGNASNNSLPVCYLDTATGLPVTPNGGNISVTWDSAGIFTLSDQDAKENVELIGMSGQANFYKYNYIGDPTPRLGLLAQEVEVWCPEAVKVVDKRKYVDYGRALQTLAKLS
jgi:hypothetical protein